MSRVTNRFTLIGRLGKDAEQRTTKHGTELVTFSIPTSDKWTDANGQKQERTDWHDCVAYNKVAERMIKLGLYKGDHVAIQAEVKYNIKEKIKYTQIVVDAFELLSRANNKSQQTESPANSPAPKPPETEKTFDPVEDEIPF